MITPRPTHTGILGLMSLASATPWHAVAGRARDSFWSERTPLIPPPERARRKARKKQANRSRRRNRL